MKFQIFSKRQSPRKSIHSFIRELFPEGAVLASLDLGEQFLIQMKPGSSHSSSISQSGESEVADEYAEGDFLTLSIRLALDYSCAQAKSGKGRKRTKLMPDDAMRKFCEKTGLAPLARSATATFLGIHKEKNFNIHNAFEVAGIFQVVDAERLKAAINSGVGSHKSYGFGLLLVHPKTMPAAKEVA